MKQSIMKYSYSDFSGRPKTKPHVFGFLYFVDGLLYDYYYDYFSSNPHVFCILNLVF